MKGVLLALSTVIVWAILNVVNRFCVLQYDVNIMVFTSFMIFATGVTLMIIRKQVMPQNWKSGVKYSWLYTIMQIIRSFTMISTFLYITSTETSLLFNIEIIITYILAYAIFRRIPYKGDFLGILIILLGFILFIFSLPVHHACDCLHPGVAVGDSQLHPLDRRGGNHHLESGYQRPAKMRYFRIYDVLRRPVPDRLFLCHSSPEIFSRGSAPSFFEFSNAPPRSARNASIRKQLSAPVWPVYSSMHPLLTSIMQL